MLLEYFNAEVSKEDILKISAEDEILHEISNDNGIRVVNFATSKCLIVNITVFPHRNVHKITSTSPDEKTHNDIDHNLIDRRRH
jgi:hypothetical protein